MRAIAAFAFAILMSFPGASLAQPAPCQAGKPDVRMEGAAFVNGTWQVSGSYANAPDGVDFQVTFSPDGTFIDRDGYPGRWIISGANFSMFYPDESQLGYVGQIEGDAISGRFQGLTAAGTFRMTRR